MRKSIARRCLRLMVAHYKSGHAGIAMAASLTLSVPRCYNGRLLAAGFADLFQANGAWLSLVERLVWDQ